MDIKIPKEVIRYTPEVMKELIDKGFFDDTDTMHEKYEMIQNNVKQDFYHKPVETIGMWMSGGADSSMCAYLLCKKIKEEKLNIKFQPLSVRRGRGWNPIYAGNVIDFIEKELDFKMNDHIIYYPDINDEYQREIKEFRDRDTDNFNSGLIDILYSGITCNPPENDKTISKNKERTRDESSERPLETWSGFAHYINPFFKINKKDIKKLYDENGLTHTLFPITRSCEGSDYQTGNYTYHCGKCWWCEERLWAFGFLDNYNKHQYVYE